MEYPILYTFRRCPYAMRVRLALTLVDIDFELREIDLRDRPQELYDISSKGTVPVLQLREDVIIDESLEIMNWVASAVNTKKNSSILKLDTNMIAKNDEDYKYYLDRYKYFVRYPDHSQEYYRKKLISYWNNYEIQIKKHKFICGQTLSLTDYAIFPFIRQAIYVNEGWFEKEYPFLYYWVINIVNSAQFQISMNKTKFWEIYDLPLILNFMRGLEKYESRD